MSQKRKWLETAEDNQIVQVYWQRILNVWDTPAGPGVLGSEVLKWRGAWVAQWVERPTLAQVMISQFVGSSPASGCLRSAQGPLQSLCPPLSLSKKKKKVLKSRRPLKLVVKFCSTCRSPLSRRLCVCVRNYNQLLTEVCLQAVKPWPTQKMVYLSDRQSKNKLH